jgi:4-hydroxy-3-polyprenylbenzoate decarboxylase
LEKNDFGCGISDFGFDPHLRRNNSNDETSQKEQSRKIAPHEPITQRAHVISGIPNPKSQIPMHDVVLAITGASGSIYAIRLLEVLLVAGHTVHLTISKSAALVLDRELGLHVDLDRFKVSQIFSGESELAGNSALQTLIPDRLSLADISSVVSDAKMGSIAYHHYQDFGAGIASGSFLTEGMIICPCSMGTLASIAGGHSENLIQRAADVHLKERRKLILVPRETPLSSIQLENMKRLADAGVTVMPAMPGFYHNPRSIQDLVDFVVGRICDHLGIQHKLFKRWGDEQLPR